MNLRLRQACCLILALSAVCFCLNGCLAKQRPTLTVSAAASLQDTIVELETVYQRKYGAISFHNNFGASGTLAREIEQGAPVDVVLSASKKQLDQLQSGGLIETDTQLDLLRNSLVLVAPLDSSLHGFDQLDSKQVKLIAMGDPEVVPAGQYGKQTLTYLHIYDKLKRRLVLGKDVRQVLAYVESGNVDAGLVYATDAQSSKRVRIVAMAPEASHEPISYLAAVVKGSRNEQTAREFVEFLTSSDARAIFLRHGFTMA